MKKILVIGPYTLDFVSKVKELPKGNEDIVSNETFARISGFGWNCANLLDSLKVPYDVLATVGIGEYAEYIIDTANKLNIALPYQTNEINGCTYTMLDKEGHTASLVVQGGEYTFPYEEAGLLDLNEYSSIILSGLMLQEDSIGDLFTLLEEFDGKIYFVTGSHSLMLDSEIMNSLYALKPIIISTGEDLINITNNSTTNSLEAAELITLKTEKPVIIFDREQALAIEHDDIERETSEEKLLCLDESGMMDNFAVAYALAHTIGIQNKSALKFACTVSKYVGTTYETILPQTSIETIQKAFTDAILNEH